MLVQRSRVYIKHNINTVAAYPMSRVSTYTPLHSRCVVQRLQYYSDCCANKFDD